MLDISQRIHGAIYGLLIGDAVGVPYEFNSPDALPPIELIDMIPPQNFPRTYPSVPIGTWSDDGAQALCLLASLIHCNEFDDHDFMNRICNWYQYGYMAVDSKIFDVGIQTSDAIQRYLTGVPLPQVAKNDERSNGNGALMRVLPLALWHQGSDEQLVCDAFAQSHITHAHIRSKLCCAIYCLWARNILKGQTINQAWNTSKQYMFQYCQKMPETLYELEHYIYVENKDKPKGTGYVVDCLNSAYYALQENEYSKIIKKAISLGNDTDTTACVAGGIAGLYYGLNAIPNEWKQKLRGKDLVEDLLDKLIKSQNRA
jgi:ADP-ribosyl-[dinitrogen reductase] hydrolase